MAKEKNTQWHPLAGDLLNRTLGREYQLGPEQPVGDLPKRADFVLERPSTAVVEGDLCDV